MSNENTENPNVWTLDAMEEELQRQYAPLEFVAKGTKYVLLPLLRLTSTARKAVQAKLELIDTDDEAEVDEDQVVESLEFVFRTVTKDGKGDKLVDLLDGDLLRLMTLLSRWTKATQPGEASDSES
jgi:hypothetical protein